MSYEAFEAAQRRVLERFRLDAESRFVRIPAIGGRAHVLTVGSGSSVVMLNGIGCPAAMWAPLMARLSGYRIVAIDAPGCGLTDGAVTTTDGVRARAVAFLEQALDALEIDRPAFVANSMGSLWALWLALDRPDRVAAMVHVGTPAVVLGTSAPLPMRLMSVPPVGRLLTRLRPPSIARMNQTAAMVHVDLDRQPEVREVMVASERMPDAAESFLSLLHACIRVRGARPEVAFTAAQLAEVAQPVQLVWGNDDPFGPVPVARRVAELLPDARLDLVRGGHAPWIERAEEIGALAVDFLSARYARPHAARASSGAHVAASS